MVFLLAFLPFATAAALIAALFGVTRSVRKSLAYAGIGMLALTFAGTETLSLFGALRPVPIRLFWAFCSVGACLAGWLGTRAPQRRVWKRIRVLPRTLPEICVSVVALSTLTVAILAPPNTWDGMTYHMSRVVHWLQNGSIACYPTYITRQNAMPPLGEETILQFQALTASDRLANIPAWVYSLLSLLMVQLLALAIGLRPRLAWFCTAFASLIPMALFQSTSCKNDAITSFLCLAFVYALIELSRGWRVRAVVVAGIALGLGLYCKGTVLLICGAAGIAFTVLCLSTRDATTTRMAKIGHLAVVVVLAGIIASPHAIRAYEYGRTTPGDDSTWTATMLNQDARPSAIAAVLVRNAALHLALPSPTWNNGLYNLLKSVCGTELNNPNTTFLQSQFRVIYWMHEDYAGNPLHFLAAVAAMGILLVNFTRLSFAERFLFCTVVLAAFFFGALLRWQPWASRLHSPIFYLGVPMIGLAARLIGRWSIFTGPIRRMGVELVVLVLAFAAASPALFANPSRPLLSIGGRSIVTSDRRADYFRNRPELWTDYLTIDRILRSARGGRVSVGLVCGEDDWEYPFYVFSDEIEGNPAYDIHKYGLGAVDSIVLAVAATRRQFDTNPQAQPVYRGSYLSLYVLNPR